MQTPASRVRIVAIAVLALAWFAEAAGVRSAIPDAPAYPGPAEEADPILAEIVEVVSATELIVQIDGERMPRPIGLAGVRMPIAGKDDGVRTTDAEGLAFMRLLLEGERVSLKLAGRSASGIMHAEVRRKPDGLPICIEIVRAGLAVPARNGPAHSCSDVIRAYAERAASIGRGTWGEAPEPIAALPQPVAGEPTAQTPEADTPAPAGVGFVFVTRSGKKYHRETCRYAKSGEAIDLAKAQASYEPCRVCKPE
ncbi:MAG: hypothetical protein AAF747_05200 [Planctomycetota bacterium]